MIIIEIPDNPNCETVDMRVFHDLEPPKTVRQVRLERRVGAPEWYAVTGWTVSGEPCPAQQMAIPLGPDRAQVATLERHEQQEAIHTLRWRSPQKERRAHARVSS